MYLIDKHVLNWIILCAFPICILKRCTSKSLGSDHLIFMGGQGDVFRPGNFFNPQLDFVF